MLLSLFLRLLIPDLKPGQLNLGFFFILWVTFILSFSCHRLKFKFSPFLFSLVLILLLSFREMNAFSYQQLLLFFSYLTLFILSYNFLPGKEFVRVLQIVGIIISLYVLFQVGWVFPYLREKFSEQELLSQHHLNYILTRGRAFGLFLNSNSLAGFLIFILPLGFSCLPQMLKYLYLSLLLGGIYLSKSMGAWLILGALSVAGGLQIKKWRKVCFFIFSICLLSLGLIVFQRKELLFNPQNLYFNPFYQRGEIWSRTLKLVSSSPLRGLGLGNFPIYYNLNLPSHLNQTLYAHNLFLQFWSELGILGLLWMMVFYLLFFREIKKLFCENDKIRICLGLGCLSFLIHNLIDFTFYIPKLGIIFWSTWAIFLKAKKDGD